MTPAHRRSSPPDQPLLKVRGPADLVAAIPYLLGFHPAESLVLIGLDPARRGRVVVTARADLADVVDSPEFLRHAVAGLARGGARALVAAVFTGWSGPPLRRESLASLPWAGVAAELAAAARDMDLDLQDAMLVCGRRVWSYFCADDCCPADGRVLEGSALPAELTYAGLVALPDRESVAATLDPAPDAEREQLRAALVALESQTPDRRPDTGAADRSVKRALFTAARTVSPGLPAHTVVRFGAALRRRPVRDPVWIAIDDGRLDGRDLWQELGRRLPSPFDAAPLFLFAWASYREGNGALAGMAAERVLASDPDYAPADLVLAALANAVDPRTMPRLRRRSA